MTVEFRLPSLGEGITDADVLRVLVKPGDAVQAEQSVIEIETDKATIEVPAPSAGTVASIHVKEGETVAVGQLVIVLEDGVSAPAPVASAASAAPASTAAPPRTEAGSAGPSTGSGRTVEERPPGEIDRGRDLEEAAVATPTAVAAPAADVPREPVDPSKVQAPEPAVPAAAPPSIPGSTPVSMAASGATLAAAPAPFASPSVRKFAREVGVDLKDVRGSGPGGRISEDDVKHAAREVRRGVAPPTPAPASVPTGGIEVPPLPDFAQFGAVEREPLTRFRRTVARNMATSWAIIPHVTLHRWVDVTELEALRQRYKQRAADSGGSLTVTVILLKIVAAALKAHPRMNASVDLESGELILKRYYDIGVAVDTPRGLTVPVVRGVDDKNIIELSAELSALAEKARAGDLGVDDMRGGTFTLTNLGGMGIGEFTPIINWPEVAVLGVGRAEQQPALVNGAWEPRLRMPLSLSHDHRVIDGADGARFLTWIEEAIAEPLLIALEG